MTHTLTDLENAQRYAKLAARLLEKAAEAKSRGEHELAESRAENAQNFLSRATRALTEGPAVRALFEQCNATLFNTTEPWAPPPKDPEVERWLQREYIRRHRLSFDFCMQRELLPPKTHEECIANGWLKETTPGVWQWDFEQMDRDANS